MGLSGQLVERKMKLSRHGGDLVLHAAAVCHEEGINEVARVEPRLGDEFAQARAAAQAAETLEGCRHTGRGSHRQISLARCAAISVTPPKPRSGIFDGPARVL